MDFITWQDWAYGLSEPLLYLACVLLVWLLALLVGFLLWAHRRLSRRVGPSTLPVGLVTGIAVPASLVIGLLANDVVRKYNDAQNGAQQEAYVLADLRFSLASLPPPVGKKLTAELDEYVASELPAEWQRMRESTEPLGLSPALVRLAEELATLSSLRDPQGRPVVGEGRLDALQGRLRALRQLRATRAQLALGRMDNSTWTVVLMLLACCAGVMLEITLDNRPNYRLTLLLFMLSYGSLVYMIVTNDRPFSGGTSVALHPLQQAYALQPLAAPPPSR